MLDHKTRLNKFKKIEIISSIFSDHYSMKLEISNRKKAGKVTNIQKSTHSSTTNGSKRKSKRKF